MDPISQGDSQLATLDVSQTNRNLETLRDKPEKCRPDERERSFIFLVLVKQNFQEGVRRLSNLEFFIYSRYIDVPTIPFKVSSRSGFLLKRTKAQIYLIFS